MCQIQKLVATTAATTTPTICALGKEALETGRMAMVMGMPIEMERNFPVTQLEGAHFFLAHC